MSVLETDYFPEEIHNATNRTYDNVYDLYAGDEEQSFMIKFGNGFYFFVTPVILMVGLCGNSLSLCVFFSKKMRRMSASRYLAALSICDLMTLIFYVLSEWLRRGLPTIAPGYYVSFLDTPVVCQVWLHFSYLSRFLSAWLIVTFTCERFIGVCMPLRRRNLGSLKETNRIITILLVLSCVLAIYKPLTSEVRTINNMTACTSKVSFEFEAFVLDSLYALIITLVPFVIISTLNILIIRKLLNRKRKNKFNLVTEENSIRLEFTFILLAISFFFIALNLPFFSMWVKQFLHSHYLHSTLDHTDDLSFEYWQGVTKITRTIFYINYCINFFLYSITGACFRRQLRALFSRSRNSRRSLHRYQPTGYGTQSTNVRSRTSRV
ncbi:cysteinyl leukotriene receptor 2-like [Dreissena polymorpha]|uniref:cysteinyl leukotriene receptor 2-like n=1 Tax=Dreissena polymorpha TaxID=45954 RepID=UPI00226504C1|nr:cysteinyl leukotriene receptor 2-like [Dreissena polymorpha]